MKNTMQEYLHKFQKEHRRVCRYASVLGVLALITVLVVNWQLHRTGVAMSSDDPQYVCGLEEHEHSLKEGCYEVNEADLICGHTEGEIIDAAAAAAYDAANGKGTSTSAESASSAGTSGAADSSTSGSSSSADSNTATDSNTNNSGNTSSADSDSGSSDNSGNTGTNSSNASRIEELNKQITELENQEIPTQKEHHHTDACYEEKTVETEAAKTEKELACGKSEHTHDDACYTQEEGSEEKTLTCSQEEHAHDDSCYTEKTIEAQTTTEKTLICGYEEGQMVPMSEEEIQQAKDEKDKKLEELRTQLAEAESASQQQAQTAESAENTTPAESNSNAAATENAGTGSNAQANTATDDSATSGTSASTSGAGETADANASASASGTNEATSANASASGSGKTTDASASASGSGETTDASTSASADTAKMENASSADTVNDGRHHHTIECYSTYKLLCEKTEHKHTSACLIDKNADVETAADWEATIPGLSGDRAVDLISVARSQLGYTESTRNYDEESHRGYTRYGEWYGNPYGDWGTFFTAFCLHYAQITDVPTNSGVQAWISNVQSADLWWDASESNCIKEGDLVFFNDGNDHMGIISSISGSAISVIEGNRPNGDGADSVQENTYDTSDGNIAGYCELPVENHDDQIKVMDSAYGADFSQYIGKVTFQKIVDNEWKDATEFLTTDSVRGKLEFSNFPTSELKNNNNKCYITLPDNIDCSAFASDTTIHYVYDGTNQVGTYTYVKDANGKWNILVDVYDSYVNAAGENVHGTVNFEFKWDVSDIPDEGKTETVQIGKWSGTVTIKEGNTEENAFKIEKSASDAVLDSDGYVYIDYTVKLTVNAKNGYQGPIEMTDVLTGKGFEFVSKQGDTVTIEKTDGTEAHAAVTMKSSESTDSGLKAVFSIAGTNSDGKVEAGTYKITYRVKTSQKFGEDSNLTTNINNKATVTHKGKDYSSEIWKEIKTGTIEKKGSQNTENGEIYVTYKVTVNGGSVTADLQKETNFTDTIPNELELIKDSVTITQYKADGTKTDTSIAYTYDEQTKLLSSTLPKGQYKYEIVYKTKVKDISSIPVAGLTVENTAHSEGGIDGSSTDKQTITNNELLKKEFVSKEFSTADGKDVVLLKWKSTLNVEKIQSGLVYEDWGNVTWKNNAATATMYMTNEQRAAVVLRDSSGNVIDAGKYTVSEFNKQDSGAEVGLFQITFNADVDGPVTIEYETTGDLSTYNTGEQINYTNYFKFMDQTKQASTTIIYVLEDHGIIWKHKGDYEWNGANKGTVTLNPGENTLTWYVSVNNKSSSAMTNIDLVITDQIKDNMTFVEGSLRVQVAGWQYITENVQYSCQDGKLTIKIPKELNTGKIEIVYKTKLPDDFIKGSETTKDFTNTAEIEYNGNKQSSSYTQTVTKTIVEKKFASYDKDLRILTYEIVINADANTLNGGSPLTVTDTISAGSLQQYVKLNSLSMYSVSKSTGSDGKVSCSAGTFIQSLTADDAEPTQEGYYYYDAQNVSFKAMVPDGKAFVLVAQYSIEKEFATDTEVTNAVSIHGKSEWKGSDVKKTLEHSTSATIRTDKDTLTVWKRDKTQYSTLLNGAVFKLEEYDTVSGQWVAAGTIKDDTQSDVESGTESTDSTQSAEAEDAVTDNTLTTANGGRTSTTIVRNRLYKLTETAAPENYILDPTPTYFLAHATGDSSYTLPDSITGDDNYSKDKVDVREVTPLTETKDETTGTITITGYGNIDIIRYNERDKTKVSTGELSVQKIWMDSNGNKISTYTDLEKQPKITVTLTKHTPEMYKITVNGNQGTQCVVEVPKGATSTVKLSGYSDSTSNNGAISYDDSEQKVVISGITGDISLEINKDVSGTYAQDYVWKEVSGADTLQKTQETVISTQELSNENEWYYLWKDLEVQDYIAYTLTEETVDGYKATYQLNKKDLEEGTQFSLGTGGDFITITNSPDRLYTLPKTGGSGVMPIYLAGGMLTAGAAGLWVTKKNRKREQ